jgi:RNA polymerase-binding transcription factor
MATKINTPTPNIRSRKAMLEASRKQLLGASRDREEILIETLPDPTDQVKSLGDRDIAVQRLDQQSRVLHDIEAALEKLRNETYGSCERCGEPISSKRLAALPWARLCFACQSEAEAAEPVEAFHFKRAA